MTPSEQELRRALAERIGRPSPDFAARVLGSLRVEKAVANHVPALAVILTAIITAGTIGVLMVSRHASELPRPSDSSVLVPGVISTPSPTACCSPYTAQLSSPSRMVVWALVNGTSLFHSADRGVTWEPRPMVDPGGGVSEISFVNDREGWVLTRTGPQCQAERAVLWRTLDAGSNWQRAGSVDLGAGQCARGLSFVDATHGFLGAWDRNDPPVIYRTTDGGETWATSSPLQDPLATHASPPRFAARPLLPGWVRAFGSTLLVSAAAGTGISPEYVFRSSDGGANWVYTGIGPDLGTPIAFVTASQWLQLAQPLNGNGLPGPSVETTDAGASWHAFATDYWDTSFGPELVFSDPLTGYTSCPTACADLKKTIDGGTHWTSLNTPRA